MNFDSNLAVLLTTVTLAKIKIKKLLTLSDSRSIHVVIVINNFMNRWSVTKSSDPGSAFLRGYVSRPYNTRTHQEIR